jgi:hypothetical protein
MKQHILPLGAINHTNKNMETGEGRRQRYQSYEGKDDE